MAQDDGNASLNVLSLDLGAKNKFNFNPNFDLSKILEECLRLTIFSFKLRYIDPLRF